MYLFATLLARKGLFTLSTESLTLTESVCSKVRVYLQGAKQGKWAAHALKTWSLLDGFQARLFFFNLFFNWRIITLQCCASFCGTTTWISHIYIYLSIYMYIYVCMCIVKVKSLSRVRLLVIPWTAAYQAPPSMGFSRQEYWNGLPFPSPGIYTYTLLSWAFLPPFIFHSSRLLQNTRLGYLSYIAASH